MSRPRSRMQPALKKSSTCVVLITGSSSHILSDVEEKLFCNVVRRLWYHACPSCRSRRRRETIHYHSKHWIARRNGRFLERNNYHREM